MYNSSRGPSHGGGFRTPPVKVGEELDVSIDAVGEKGDGIATKNGFVLFVPGVKVGDKVRIRVTKVLSKVGFAEVITGSAAPAGESAAAEAPAEEAVAEEEEDDAEDSEDFGEEAPAAPEDHSSTGTTEESDGSGDAEDSGESDGSGESYSDDSSEE